MNETTRQAFEDVIEQLIGNSEELSVWYKQENETVANMMINEAIENEGFPEGADSTNVKHEFKVQSKKTASQWADLLLESDISEENVPFYIKYDDQLLSVMEGHMLNECEFSVDVLDTPDTWGAENESSAEGEFNEADLERYTVIFSNVIDEDLYQSVVETYEESDGFTEDFQAALDDAGFENPHNISCSDVEYEVTIDTMIDPEFEAEDFLKTGRSDVEEYISKELADKIVKAYAPNEFTIRIKTDPYDYEEAQEEARREASYGEY